MSSISVVIPVLDDAELLERCLRALAEQDRPADEIVVVDNGSTDGSADVARAAGARLVVEPRRGIASASATGFDSARGDLLARLDADSVPPTDWLQRLEQHFDGDSHIDAVTGTADFLDAGPVTSWFGRVAYLGWYFWAMGLLLGHPPLFGSNFGMRATAWRRMRGTFHRGSRSVHDDLDLSFQVRPGMTVVFDPALGMQISARPFDSVPSMLLRSWRGIATLAINWPGWMYRRAQFARRRHAASGHSSLARGSRPSLP